MSPEQTMEGKLTSFRLSTNAVRATSFSMLTSNPPLFSSASFCCVLSESPDIEGAGGSLDRICVREGPACADELAMMLGRGWL